MQILIITTLFFQFIYATCSDLNYDDCLYWSSYCEWNNSENQCQDIGGGTGGGTGGGAGDAAGAPTYPVLVVVSGCSRGRRCGTLVLGARGL